MDASPLPGYEREGLERQLETESGGALLRKLQRHAPQMSRFGSWPEVTAFMHDRVVSATDKDSVLRAITTARDEDRHPLWMNVFLLIFWPGLLNLFGTKRRWDPDAPDERWQTIITAFVAAVARLDVRRRPERLAGKIMGDTFHEAHRAYKACWEERGLAPAVDPEVFEVREDAVPGVNFEAMELREAQQRRLAEYRQALETGVIGELDFLLLTATAVYGKSIADYAEERGVTYESAKKRRQRGLAAVAEWRRRR
jgi:hypothetical protein